MKILSSLKEFCGWTYFLLFDDLYALLMGFGANICVEISSGCMIENWSCFFYLSSCECGLLRFILVMRFKGLII